MTRLSVCVAILCLIATAQRCPAADAPTVKVQGTTRSTFIPDTVQVRWRVYAHGMTAKSALKKLHKSRAALEKRLTGLEDIEATHDFGPCLALKETKGRLEQMQVQIFQNAMGQGNNDDDDDDKLLRMAFTATMEWKLTGESLEDAYRAVDAVKRQLDEIGVLADDDAKKKANEKEDSEAEAGDKDAEEPGAAAKVRITDGPRFYFIKRLSDEEMKRCAKLAFEDARQRAARMATAAGRSLGALVRLSDSLQTANSFREMQESTIAMSGLFGQGKPTFDEDKNRPANEVVSDDLKPVAYETTLSAVFTLE
jgi:hypothetical protein